MRQVREVLRLRTARVGLNQIACRVGVAPSTVRLTLKRLASVGFDWPLPGRDDRRRAGGGTVRFSRQEEHHRLRRMRSVSWRQSGPLSKFFAQHKLLTNRSCSIVEHDVSSSRGEATITARHRAREIATFSRLRE